MAILTKTTVDLEPRELAEANRLPGAEVEAWKAEARDWRLQYLICHSFVRSLSRSLVWRLLRPLRALRQLLRPRGFRVNDLIPWHDLECRRAVMIAQNSESRRWQGCPQYKFRYEVL